MKERLTVKDTKECLVVHQKWRKGGLDDHPMSIKATTVAIDSAIYHLEQIEEFYQYVAYEHDFLLKNSDYYDANMYDNLSYHKGFKDALLQIKDIVDARLGYDE